MPRSLLPRKLGKFQEDAQVTESDANVIVQEGEEIIIDAENDAVMFVCTQGTLEEETNGIVVKEVIEKEIAENVVELCEPAMADHGYVAYPPWMTSKSKCPVATEVLIHPDINSICHIDEITTDITSGTQIDEASTVEVESETVIPESIDANSRTSRVRVSTRNRHAKDGFVSYPEKNASKRSKRVAKTRKPLKRNATIKGKQIINATVEIFDSVEHAVERMHMESDAPKDESILKRVAPGDTEEYSPENNRHFIRWSRKGNKTIKQWECGKCQLLFNHQYTLMKHVESHTENKFFCDICGKTFNQASTLCRHKTTHSDVRDFLCQFCGKCFNRSSSLISHKRTHSKDKSYICEVCGKGFHQKGNLKNHLFTHTDERPYKCDKCDRGFNQMSNLMCHKAHAHINKPKFKCQLCDAEFSRKLNLRAHEGCVHNINRKSDNSIEFNDQPTKWGRPSNNARTITLPNGDKTINFNDRIKKELLQKVLDKKNKAKKLVEKKDKAPDFSGILIPRIDVDGVREAEEQGLPVFASLKPTLGIPVLVKVVSAENNMHVLVPASAEELKTAGKITVSSAESQNSGVKAVQVKVPVVATIIQKITEEGDMYLEIVPHTPQRDSPDKEDVLQIDNVLKVSDMSPDQILALAL